MTDRNHPWDAVEYGGLGATADLIAIMRTTLLVRFMRYSGASRRACDVPASGRTMGGTMSLKVYDYRSDIVNMLVTPQIRCRFLKMAVGQFNAGHTHDLGHEIFLILQGRAEFEIDGQSAVLGPGQMCIALTDQYHTVRNVGDDEVIMFLSVHAAHPAHAHLLERGRHQTAVAFRRLRRVRRAG